MAMKTYTLFLILLLANVAFANHYHFIVKETSIERLCKSKKILTVNGKFPGPTIYANKGSTLIVHVHNNSKYNITIHWHGVKQPQNPWSDGPEYITQCPIQPGSKFKQKIILSDEEGTIWWHAHNKWARATVHGAIIVYPKPGTSYPFPKPHAEIPIILGEWWKDSVVEVLNEFVGSGGQPKTSDAFMINGQPGDFYPCSKHVNFSASLRSLASKLHPISVPTKVETRLVSTVSVNLLPCPKNDTRACQGPNGTRLSASMNNISFLTPPRYNILEAYYYNRVKGMFGMDFPDFPPYVFNYTDDVLPLELELPKFGTQVKVLKYNTTVELVLQGTNLVTGLDHPMHLHGYNFYVVGWGLGNFDEKSDPKNYNLVDPPRRNNVAVPKNGWIAIRFRADNPGVWTMHCHIERHLTWGMQTVFLVKNGHKPEEHILPPPHHMPPC
uniref:Laccase n=1 Tax=Solanum tuberosum TaxID=4113 RepID=M1BF08_SOLTU